MFVVWIWSRFLSDPAISFVVLDKLLSWEEAIVLELLWCNQLGFGVSGRAWHLTARSSGYSVEHKWFHWTWALDKTILSTWWIKVRIRSCNHQCLPKSQRIQHLSPQSTGNDCCCFARRSFSHPLLCLLVEKICWYTQSSNCPRFLITLKPEWTPASLDSPQNHLVRSQALNKSLRVFSPWDAPQFPMIHIPNKLVQPLVCSWCMCGRHWP